MNKNYILLPVFNDWKSLNKVLKILNKNFKKNKSTNHVIIINDASTTKISLGKSFNEPAVPKGLFSLMYSILTFHLDPSPK